VADIAGIAEDFDNLNLGEWDWNTDDWNFDLSPAFDEIIEIVSNIVQNDDEFEDYFIDVLDQLYVDFEELSEGLTRNPDF